MWRAKKEERKEGRVLPLRGCREGENEIFLFWGVLDVLEGFFSFSLSTSLSCFFLGGACLFAFVLNFVSINFPTPSPSCFRV